MIPSPPRTWLSRSVSSSHGELPSLDIKRKKLAEYESFQCIKVVRKALGLSQLEKVHTCLGVHENKGTLLVNGE